MPARRLQLLLFFSAFITFAWFHQGGGWNQNARFAEVRALVEEGRLAINDYMVYRPGEGRKLVRPRVERGEFQFGGARYQLSWGDWRNLGTEAAPDWQQLTVNDTPLDPAATMVVIGEGTCTGDVGYAPDGHFHPNKPPGASLLAVPPYFVIYHVERWLGMDPDDWWVMNVNAWLCSLLTVGLASAMGVMLFWRVASEMFPVRPGAALGAAIVFGFGTTFFPFATLMFDHNLVAVFLLASFASARDGKPFSAGIWAGVAAVTNYLAAVPGAMFGVWILCSRRRKEAGISRPGDSPAEMPASFRRRLRWGDAVRFTLGVLPCLAALIAYNVAAFCDPLALNTNFQNPAFKETAPAFLGMFTWPSWFAAIAITVSPWRGLFVLSPVIVATAVVLVKRLGMKELVAERRIILGCAAYFFLINVCFNGFHGGFAAGPRYLIPALPFVCLPLAVAFARWPRTTSVLAAVSIAQQALLTVTDALNPLGVGSHAWVNRPGEWIDKLAGNSIVWRYAWPLFSQGRAWPVIDAKFEEWFELQQRNAKKDGTDAAALTRRRAEAWSRIEQGSDDPLMIAAIPGPVSVNVLGLWDGTYFQLFPAHSEAANWAAFNLGETIWPQSRWSIAPLLVLWFGGGLAMRRCVRQQRAGAAV